MWYACTYYNQMTLGHCSSPITISTVNNSSVILQWVRGSSNNYQVVVTSCSTMMTYEVTSFETNISYQISGLNPLTSYTVNVTGESELISCLKTFTTSEEGTSKCLNVN